MRPGWHPAARPRDPVGAGPYGPGHGEDCEGGAGAACLPLRGVRLGPDQVGRTVRRMPAWGTVEIGAVRARTTACRPLKRGE